MHSTCLSPCSRQPHAAARTHVKRWEWGQVCRGASTCNGHADDKASAGGVGGGGGTKAGAHAAAAGDGCAKAAGATGKEKDEEGAGVGGGGGGKGEGESKRVKGFLFLRELFEIAKPLQMTNQMNFYRALNAVGLFSILEVSRVSGVGCSMLCVGDENGGFKGSESWD
jgi:hypothetical protein